MNLSKKLLSFTQTLLILLVCFLFIPGCRKKESEQINKSGEQSAAKKEAPVSSSEENNGDEGMMLLDINLPEPMYVGTPQNFRVPNLEKPLGKPRPPISVPIGTKNISLGKAVSASDEEPVIGEIDMITDGDKQGSDGSYVELGPFLQYVTIDLGAKYEIYAIFLWHFHMQPRVYYDVVIQVADDADFTQNVRTLFNNDHDNSAGLGVGKDLHYVDTAEGKLIDAKGQVAQFVRCYSNGNTQNDLNHYIEVEVYGKPSK